MYKKLKELAGIIRVNQQKIANAHTVIHSSEAFMGKAEALLDHIAKHSRLGDEVEHKVLLAAKEVFTDEELVDMDTADLIVAVETYVEFSELFTNTRLDS